MSAGLLPSRVLNISIDCPPQKIYDFASNLENLPQWATTFVRSIKKSKHDWTAQTPQGPVTIHMAPKNTFGILDHYVVPQPDVEVYVPMRVIPNGKGSEALFVLFRRPEMTDQRFHQDIKWVEADLKSLRKVMEKG